MDKKSISDVLRSLRAKSRYSQADVAAYLDLVTNAYWKIETGQTELKVDVLMKLAEFYGIPATEFLAMLQDGSTERIKFAKSELPSGTRLLPFASVRAQAGFVDAFIPQDQMQHWEKVAIPDADDLPKDSFAIEVKGDSMIPKIMPRDTVVVSPIDPSRWPELVSGQLYLICYDETITVKRVRNRINQSEALELVSENPNYEPMSVPAQKIRQVFKVHRIISRVD